VSRRCKDLAPPLLFTAHPVATIDDVHSQLARVAYPGYARDIVAFGLVRNVSLSHGRVTVALDLPTEKAEVVSALEAAVRSAVTGIAGVAGVDVHVVKKDARAETPRAGTARREPLPGIAHIIAVASGKGGVGKSTIAVNLALALKSRGLRVGLLDADIHGPSLPLMTGTAEARPRMLDDKKIVPIDRFGISLVSMGFFLDDRSPVIWRGPMVMSIVRQFLRDVLWSELDVLVVDLPPGTGDAQLTLLQEVPIAGGVIVTTPQDVALQDVRRGISMFETVQAPVLGVIENMSGYTCPQCGEHDPIFDTGGGRHEAEALQVPFLGTIPLESELRASMDRGTPLFVDQPNHPITATFVEVAQRVAATLTAHHAGLTR
jgi:ATP-binding protein involved in chromosome partitioning